MSFDWLKQRMDETGAKDSEVHIPTGGDFVRGFAGEWIQNAMWKLYTDNSVDFKELEIPYDHKVPTRSGNGYFWYWYQKAGGRKNAIEACQAIEWRAPNNVWRWEMPTTTMLNYSGDDDVTDKFGTTISVDVEVTGLLSTKRTEYHLLFLPSFIQALGMLEGSITEPIYNYDNLIYDAKEVSPEYCQRLVGELGEGGKDSKYEEGELWQARAEIWAAMDEPNPKVFTANEDPKTDTSSEKLMVPLGVQLSLGTPLWARMSRVAAPRMPNEKEKMNTENPFPFGMNVVSQIWINKEDAISDLDVEGVAGGHPDLPSQWGESVSVSDFRKWVIKYVNDNYPEMDKDAVMEIVAADDTLDAELKVKPEELVPWVEHVMG